MTFISIEFTILLAAAVFGYYIFPLKHRWFILLVFSIVFYLQGGISMFAIVMATSLITYLAAIWIEKTDADKKRKRRCILISIVSAACGLLILCKMYAYYGWKVSWFVIPIGISYYTFSIISYLADVYWKKDKAERNFLKYLLFTIFFPKIMQGPISRHNTLGPELYTGHRLDYKNFTFGLQLIVWGAVKSWSLPKGPISL